MGNTQQAALENRIDTFALEAFRMGMDDAVSGLHSALPPVARVRLRMEPLPHGVLDGIHPRYPHLSVRELVNASYWQGHAMNQARGGTRNGYRRRGAPSTALPPGLHMHEMAD